MYNYLLGIIIWLVSGFPVFAESEPKYKETVNFIRSKLEKSLSGSSNLSSTTQKFSLIENERCVFVYQNEYRNISEDGRQYETRQARVDFELLDPSRVKIESRNPYFGIRPVNVGTREERDVIGMSVKPDSGCSAGCEASSYNKYFFRMYSHEPERLQRALIHLIKLCGGKGELF